MGRRADGRTYEQLRGALSRLERTTLESNGAYYDATAAQPVVGRFTVLSAVLIERRRVTDHDQLVLFPALTASEPAAVSEPLGNASSSPRVRVPSSSCTSPRSSALNHACS